MVLDSEIQTHQTYNNSHSPKKTHKTTKLPQKPVFCAAFLGIALKLGCRCPRKRQEFRFHTCCVSGSGKTLPADCWGKRSTNKTLPALQGWERVFNTARMIINALSCFEETSKWILLAMGGKSFSQINLYISTCGCSMEQKTSCELRALFSIPKESGTRQFSC